MAKITVLAHDVYYSGRGTPAFAGVFPSATFVNDDGDTVMAADPVKLSNAYRQVAVAYASGIATIAAFTGVNAIDSTVIAANGRVLATYILALFGSNGSLLTTVKQNIKVPTLPASTTWADLETFSSARQQPPRHDYYDTEQINRLFLSRIIPPGGTAGQVLMKNSGSDYDASWVLPPGDYTAPTDPSGASIIGISSTSVAIDFTPSTD